MVQGRSFAARSCSSQVLPRVRALSPLAVLERGYAIVHRGDDVVRSAAEVAAGDSIDVRVAEGSFGATVG